MIKKLISSNIFYWGPLIIFILFIQLIPQRSIAQIKSFKFEVALNTGKIEQEVICDIYGDSLIIGVIPYQAKDLKLIPTFSMGSNNKAYINNINQESKITINDFKQPLSYEIISSGKVIYKYKVEIIYTGLPLVYVNTDNKASIVSKDDYVNGQIIIYPNKESSKFSATMQIKGRGNSTWTMPKKPYKVKLGTKASILGMPEDKEWVLLANYADKSLIRTSLALELGKKASFAYTPNMQHVDLILNGVYQGSYLIGEQIKVSKGRVNIKELDEDDNDEGNISGGYLLEVDARLDETFWFKTNADVPITIKSPEDISPEQLEYISNYIQVTEDAIYSPDFETENGYIKYINTETFIDFYWINELFKNTDAQFYSSVYLYKDRNGKLNIGPLWDFDISAGNINYNSCDYPIGWWIRDSKWIHRLFADPAFKSAADARWNELKTSFIPELMNSITTKKTLLESSQRLNFYKWSILDKYIWPNAVITGSYEGEINYLSNWLEARINWIDGQVNPSSTPGSKFALSSPEDNSSLLIPNSSTNGINFTWEKSQPGTIYKLMLDVEGENFSTPVRTVRSNNYGFDTAATLSLSELSSIFYNLNLKEGEKINLIWTVYAYAAKDSIASVKSYNLELENGIYTSIYHSSLPEIKIYPNPSTDLITIETSQKLDIEQIELCDLTGKTIEILSGQDQSGFIFLNLDQHPNGTYLLCLKGKSGEKIIKRIILN